jgi:hypothetical protein
MLQTKSIGKSLWDLLKELQKSDVFKDYFLVGGTALALQLGHRISDDIDLFTRNDINKDEILDFLNSEYHEKYQIKNIQKIIFQIIINDVKVDLVKHNFNLIEDIKTEEGIRYLGKKDIAAMKLMAVANRGDQAKDFIDIYYLLKEMPLNEMFEYYKEKYNQNDVSVIKRSLVYFDDITNTNWNAVRLLNDKLDIKAIKNKIIHEMNKYNENIIGNK